MTVLFTAHCLRQVVKIDSRFPHAWIVLDLAVATLLSVFCLGLIDFVRMNRFGLFAEWSATIGATFRGAGGEYWVRTMFALTTLIPTVAYAGLWSLILIGKGCSLFAARVFHEATAPDDEKAQPFTLLAMVVAVVAAITRLLSLLFER